MNTKKQNQISLSCNVSDRCPETTCFRKTFFNSQSVVEVAALLGKTGEALTGQSRCQLLAKNVAQDFLDLHLNCLPCQQEQEKVPN